MKKYVLFVIFAMIASFLVACTVPGNQSDEKDKIPTGTKITKFKTTDELKKFSSKKELEEFLAKINQQNTYSTRSFGFGRGPMIDVVTTNAAPMAVDESAESVSKAGSGGASSYSQTNVQVKGVDEADFVKNDEKYIYMITQNKLVIVDAYPAENAKVVSETKIGGNARNMFVNKDRLVIFADNYDETYAIMPYDYMPSPRYTQKTHVYIYDVSDRANPKEVKDYNLNGYYYDSRMIGDNVYFIATENVYYYGDVIMPMIKESSTIVARPEVFYFDNPEYNYNFNTVASFNIFSDTSEINAKTFMMGYTNTLFVSKDNIYIAYQKNLPYTYYQRHNEDRFFDVIVPLLPTDVKEKINEIKADTNLDSYERGDKISSVIEDMYNSMSKEDQQDFIEELNKAVEEYESRLAAERAKTVIHKIAIDDGNLEYGAKAEVPGYLLNQFSMDEHEGNLRVATTTDIWTSRKNVLYNNVFVLNDEMETIGKLEAIAPDERIYSTRFMGDRLYMVTFKRIDPFFVIDLSNPASPEILGELKIPGFSDYLHPYDDNHVIGIGKETEGNEWGGVSTKGVKIALFDVTNVRNPKELEKLEIGEAGSDSEALRDHKAFLFDKEKQLLVLPISEVKGKMGYDSRLGYYRQRYWQGVYVLGITLDGIEIRGKITHNEDFENSDWYGYGSPNSVRRSLYMDDALYTISERKIKANDLDDIENEIKEVKLPYEMPSPYPYPIYKGGVGIAEPAIVEGRAAE